MSQMRAHGYAASSSFLPQVFYLRVDLAVFAMD